MMKKGICLLLLFNIACSSNNESQIKNISYLAHKDLMKAKYVQANNMEDYMEYNKYYINTVGYKFIASSLFCLPQNKKWKLPSKDKVISNLEFLEANFATTTTLQDNQAVRARAITTVNEDYDFDYSSMDSSGFLTCKLVTYLE